ncbi:B12-binding domain-containing radical SAM protein [Chromobacterium piscinae]|uniref:B12-binding domain-containing radical SAM protein n=1 Tax=Chromobacterium piscinae TaxID=686831 RepID=UPI001E2F7B6F|nr:radical SAM protein [Chromobacterium piscinae]MCD5327530.1 radical SAM protein [Chromobacterium piscinae]
MRFIRAPHTSSYSMADVREDAIITYALGYLDAVGVREYDVHDFHLDRRCNFNALIDPHVSAYVLSVRETGSNVHYARRLAASLAVETDTPILLYGQTARLHAFYDWSSNVRLVQHDERMLANALGVSTDGPSFTSGLRALPYLPTIPLAPHQYARRRASLESSRGCHFKCGFCFINAGENYPSRWSLRTVSDILHDLMMYESIGITNILFHDSEFFGALENDRQRTITLLNELARRVPTVKFGIFARADTISKFGDLNLLQRAGLVYVFIGVESLADVDLRALKKGVRADDVVACVERLTSHGILVNLSFMLFNRSTTVDTLRENLKRLKRLARGNTKMLGIPNFLFSFESSWRDELLRPLSEQTYLRWMVYKRGQPNHLGVTFDPQLEPLIEVCRLGFYEIATKIAELNEARECSSEGDVVAMDKWFNILWPLGVEILEYALSQFEQGNMQINRLSSSINWVYEKVMATYAMLPERFRETMTYPDHAVHIARGGLTIALEDHGWDSVIPGGVVAEAK